MVDVSIIIPTYNRLWSLPKAVSSCFDTSLNIEVIVIDDGSTDDTWSWLSQQTKVISICQDNLGKDWAVNKGFSLANGKYIRFLDSDDWVLPNSTDELFAEAEKNGLDITCAGCLVFNDDETLQHEIPWTLCDDFLAQQLGECDSSHYSAYLFKKKFINNIPHRQEYGAFDDRKFVIEAAMEQPKTGYILTPTLAHRVHQNARLQKTSGLQESAYYLARLNTFKKCFTVLALRGVLTQRYKNAACNSLWHLAHWVAKDHLHDAKEIYDWVYELNPAFLPTENLAIARLYKNIGFTNTERLLRLRRLLK
ncbi:MAG: glycosyltransferase family 2 protein [Sphingobacteriales bacterium]